MSSGELLVALHQGLHARPAALGAVVLAFTGVEALYADMGHFGRRAITMAWYAVVLPGLALNYFGQGAWALRNPTDLQRAQGNTTILAVQIGIETGARLQMEATGSVGAVHCLMTLRAEVSGSQ